MFYGIVWIALNVYIWCRYGWSWANDQEELPNLKILDNAILEPLNMGGDGRHGWNDFWVCNVLIFAMIVPVVLFVVWSLMLLVLLGATILNGLRIGLRCNKKLKDLSKLAHEHKGKKINKNCDNGDLFKGDFNN